MAENENSTRRIIINRLLRRKYNPNVDSYNSLLPSQMQDVALATADTSQDLDQGSSNQTNKPIAYLDPSTLINEDLSPIGSVLTPPPINSIIVDPILNPPVNMTFEPSATGNRYGKIYTAADGRKTISLTLYVDDIVGAIDYEVQVTKLD